MTTTDTLIAMIRERHAAGLAKYGVTVDRTDYTPEQWLQHSIEERIDDLKYMMRLRVEIAEMRKLLVDCSKAIGLLTANQLCNVAHHEVKDRHKLGEKCPVEIRFCDLHERLSEFLEKGKNDHHNPNP